MLNLSLNSESRIVQRAAWPLSYCVINHPQLIKKHYPQIIALLSAPNQHAAVKRNILRLLDQIPQIPRACHGQIMDICFQIVEDPKEAIAPQAFALGILQKLSRIYPEIKPELKLIIGERIDHTTAAFKSRAKKILKEIG
ncbi:MAG: hypothetical protein QM640_13015 [Niabella sp.]